MARPAMVLGNVLAELGPAPINPAWVLEGTPTARKTELSRSHDGVAYTLIWDCTPGRFEWHYEDDETVHILDGSIVLDDGHPPPRRLGAGDVIFFPAGAVVRWQVETHVRKVAFFRGRLPAPVAHSMRILRHAKKVLRRKI